jgi:hypothetical protein
VDASNKVYQLLAHGWWFSSGTPASSTTKTGRHDIAAILLNTKKSNQSIKITPIFHILKLNVTCQCLHSIICKCWWIVQPLLYFTKPGANPRRIGDRFV